jgi:hypothetical protein
MASHWQSQIHHTGTPNSQSNFIGPFSTHSRTSSSLVTHTMPAIAAAFADKIPFLPFDLGVTSIQFSVRRTLCPAAFLTPEISIRLE